MKYYNDFGHEITEQKYEKFAQKKRLERKRQYSGKNWMFPPDISWRKRRGDMW